MDSILSNWKTSLTGVVIIILGALGTFLGVKVPGFSLDFGSALTVGIGLLLSKDSNVTGGTTQQ